MRIFIAAAISLAALAAPAFAQDTTMTPPAEATTPAVAEPAVVAPPSTCPAFVAAPDAPNTRRMSPEQVNAALATFEAWRTTQQATASCRAAELRVLNAQARARSDELTAAAAANQGYAAAWQTQLDAFHARQNR